MNLYTRCVISAILIGAAAGFILIPVILHFCKAKRLYDIPDARKVHHNATPRLGGVSFVPGIIITLIIVIPILNAAEGSHRLAILLNVPFLAGILLMYGMGIVDDLIGLKPLAKLVIQAICACVLPVSGIFINNLYGLMGICEIPYVIGCLLTVLIIVFIDNAMNLIDGIDGLAGCLSVIALSGFLLLYSDIGLSLYAVAVAGLTGVLLSFLYFNLFGDNKKNRKIFMGDSGSLTLGFILGFLCVHYSTNNPSPAGQRGAHLQMAFTLLIVPMFDVVRVFFVRILHHTSPFSADMNHIHHKLMKAGMSQHRALVYILALEIFYIIANYFLLKAMSCSIVLLVDILIYVIACYTINLSIKRNASKTS